MDRIFTLAEANDLLPEARRRLGKVGEMQKDMAILVADLQLMGHSELGGLAEAKAYEARIDHALGWFERQGIRVKSLAPGMLDFPARGANGLTLLCWHDGEESITHQHHPSAGFSGRQPIVDAITTGEAERDAA